MSGEDSGSPSIASRVRAFLRNRLDAVGNHGPARGLAIIGDIVGGIAAVFAIVGGIYALVHFLGQDESDDSGSPSTSRAVSQSASARPIPSSTSASSSLPDLQCWTAASAVADCRDDHRYEAITRDKDACDLAAVTAFLGGRARRDVTVTRPDRIGDICVVDLGRTVKGSARDVLLSPDSAPWRRCADRDRERGVPCSERHTGEYLGTGSPRRATQAECEIAARDYMDQDLGTVGTDLMVEALDIASGSPVPERCIIEARGSHLLDGTVHGLGVKPPPIVQ